MQGSPHTPPSLPPTPLFPITTPMEEMNHNLTVVSPVLHLLLKQTIDLQHKNDKNKHWILTVHAAICGLSMLASRF